jgi:hypothetical protein
LLAMYSSKHFRKYSAPHKEEVTRPASGGISLKMNNFFPTLPYLATNAKIATEDIKSKQIG